MGKIELRLSIDADLLARAQEVGVSPDAALEEGLRSALAAAPAKFSRSGQASGATAKEVLADERARQWAEDNAEAIEAHRERIDEFGVFGEDIRTW